MIRTLYKCNSQGSRDCPNPCYLTADFVDRLHSHPRFCNFNNINCNWDLVNEIEIGESVPPNIVNILAML